MDALKVPGVKVKCLVIQMGHMSDVLQSLMALKAAQQLYPDLEITFACRKSFAPMATRVPWIFKVIEFPSTDLLGNYFLGVTNKQELLSPFAQWVSPLTAMPWEFIFNWTFSESSSYLTGLLPARIKFGYSRRHDHSFFATDGWSQYIQGVIQKNIRQNIHVTDILTTQILTALQIHIPHPPVETLQVPSRSFFNISISRKQIYSILGDLKKRWISFAFSEQEDIEEGYLLQLCSDILHQHHQNRICIFIEKKQQREAFQAAVESFDSQKITIMNPYEDFDSWITVMSRSCLLVSNEAMHIQLASVLGTRILQFASEKERFEEFGPYGNGHWVVMRALSQVSAKDMFILIQDAILDVPLEAFAQSVSHPRLYPFYRSRVRSVADGGGVTYDSKRTSEIGFVDWNAIGISHVARFWYCGWMPPLNKEMIRQSFSAELLKSIRKIESQTENLKISFKKAQSVSHEIQEICQKVRSDRLMDVELRYKLTQLSESLSAIEQDIENITGQQPGLEFFSEMLKVMMYNLPSSELIALGKEAHEVYQQMLQGLEVYEQWIQFSLQLSKPKIVQKDILELAHE